MRADDLSHGVIQGIAMHDKRNLRILVCYKRQLELQTG